MKGTLKPLVELEEVEHSIQAAIHLRRTQSSATNNAPPGLPLSACKPDVRDHR